MYCFTQSLPYLLNRVGVRMGELFGRELAADGLTVPIYRVLAALSEGGDQRLTDLNAMTSIEMTTLSRLVATMERRRLVLRRRPKDNLRTVQISLTGTGRALAERLLPRASHYEQTALRDLGAQESETLKATLVAVYRNLDQIAQEQAEAAGSMANGVRSLRRKAA